MKTISYKSLTGETKIHWKLKSGLAPTGVFRQISVLHNSFQVQIYAARNQKTNVTCASGGLISDGRLASMSAGKERTDEPAASYGLNSGPALYLVGTPIGNLEDITLRALRVLREVDLIACEDTRHTQKLLNHYSIVSRVTSYHEHNEFARAKDLVRQLEQGKRIALVTDAGMPGISDPGFRLISLALEHRIPVVPIPGPSAFLTALTGGGLPADTFRYHGFLPSKRGQRRQILESIKSSEDTEVFYEAPHRLKESVEDIAEVLGANRQVVIARELTKIHEEFLRGTAGELLNALIARTEIKGEITLLVAKYDDSQQALPKERSLTVRARVEAIIAEEALDEKAALKKVAKERGLSKSEAYRELQRSKAK
jgi:16S rRNA (cytidine1402-2'-O)-methyltransferase